MMRSAMVCIACTASATALPLARASSADLTAIFSVSAAFSELCLMFAAICSTAAEDSSVAEA